jgi:hypothetical protein
MRMACEQVASYADEFSFQDLDRLANSLGNQEQPPHPFDVCDPGTDTASSKKGFCAWVASARADQQWSDQLRAISDTWSPVQRRAMESLKRASRFYLTAISGSDDDRNVLRNSQLQQIEAMEAGHLPSNMAMAIAEAETQLNATFRKLTDQLRAPSEDLHGMHSVRLEMTEQMEWTAFRNAWIELITTRFPNLDANKWRSQLTLERVMRLQEKSKVLPPVNPQARDWLATCSRYRDTPLPAEINSIRSPNLTEQTPKLKICNSASSYYGLGSPVDNAEARRCASLERLALVNPWAAVGSGNPNPLDVLSISGPATLTMIYANGNGAQRNAALAMRFACESLDDGVPQLLETDGSVKDEVTPAQLLADVATTSTISRRGAQSTFDMCRYAPDLDWDISACDYIGHLLDAEQRAAAIKSFSVPYTLQQKAAYYKLVSAFQAYIKAHNENETTTFGHHPGTPQWERQPQQENSFILAIRAFERGKLPSFEAPDLARADQALNSLYREKMATAANATADGGENRPTPKGLRDTERLWLMYRDAWVTFGALRYPRASKASWLTWTTLQRIDDLKAFGAV